MSSKQGFIVALALVGTAMLASPAKAQFGSQPGLSPYLYLTQGGTQGYLNYRQALGQQQLQQQLAPIAIPNDVGRQVNRTTSLQANPQTTGISQTTSQTGRAVNTTSSFMYFSHFYGARPAPQRPY